ncbi:MAG: 23S rRNA (uracil(1939)-C(5))-methyltransferase RlmD [Armatimonadota bacterium]|nr:23S rRNA (uracil(1939)-C(5))-methyltransferase RlmD [Armatimonadota bacterium]MDR7560389.1 23S rRNA (uracil(1939)-C(5))-methyltransferase RlmD [Armatimonadota bacterium]MDR7588712.1 23S rRNA (uracil(1939)-C(5))-methyltransferase RlmD [Armatimonadota bacterium]
MREERGHPGARDRQGAAMRERATRRDRGAPAAPGRIPPGRGRPAPRPRAPATLRVGMKVTVAVQSVNLEGDGVGAVGARRVAVPFALPGEEAVVEITRAGRRAEGTIVALVRRSADSIPPRCRHFGACGGCQWQHAAYPAQLAYKTALVREALRPVLDGTGAVVREAVGADPWAYRQRVQAAVGLRRDRVVAGYYARAGELRVINVQECPIQPEVNVRLLHAVRDAVAVLGWPVYDRTTGAGLVRGVVGQVGFHTGEVMVILCATREVPDRMALVRALVGRVPGLVSVQLSVQPARTPEMLGSVRLLWGRPYIEDVIAGLRLRLYATAAVPPNPRAVPLYLEAIGRAVAGAGVVVDVACEEGLVPLALSSRASRAVGVAPDRDAMHRAWENADLNGIRNCVFYTRSPAGVLRKLRERGEAVDAVVATARGEPTAPEVFAEAARAGARRLACASHSLTLLARDVAAARQCGFVPVEVQPVDLLPQTSRIHAVVALRRE